MSCASSTKRPRGEALLSQDFELLASRYADFAKELKSMQSSKKKLASKATPAFQLSLTRSLLDYHFGLELPSLPEGRLCPPVPNRWFYCNWILTQLMPMLNSENFITPLHDTRHYGLDIGTGASAIYPLLLAKLDPSLHMLASEVDPVSITSAQTNIEANNLQCRITLMQIGESDKNKGPLLQALDGPERQSLDFVITNPPFFAEPPPERIDGRDRTPMTDMEGIYPGGEVGWVLDILRDSLTIATTSVGWYTTMLSKKTSLQQLRRVLCNLLGLGHVQSTELDVGHMTRWLLAWTYHRPTGQSPLARGRSLNFQVEVNPTEECEDPLYVVAERVKTHCTTIPGVIELAVSESKLGDDVHLLTVTEKNPTAPDALLVEENEQLPERVMNGVTPDMLSLLSAKNWLPEEGHFVLQLRVSKLNSAISVQVDTYEHSRFGARCIEAITRRMEGEVCRTNRRWRRLLAKQQREISIAL